MKKEPHTLSRLLGDQLELLFDSKGQLSRATLSVGGVSDNVAPFLPGLTLENYEEYCDQLGFRRSWSEEERTVAMRVSPVLGKFCLFLEGVWVSENRILLSFCSESVRNCVCPERVLVLEASAVGVSVVSAYHNVLGATGVSALLEVLESVLLS
jgi:hypothetical protein